MNKPLITIIHNKDDNYCRLLLLYDENKYYYSERESYNKLKNYKIPWSIEIHEDNIVLHSQNNKGLLILNF